MQIHGRGAEAKLVETLSEIRDSCDDWMAIAFHMNLLQEQYRSDYQLKIAVNLVHDLLTAYEGGIFQFMDGSMVVLCNHMSTTLANKLVFQLRYLCMDDPLAYTEDGRENPGFCTTYRLGLDWQKCLNYATRRMTQVSRTGRGGEDKTEEPKAKGLFSAARLATVERELSQLDLGPAIRRQPVCAITAAGAVKRVFDELYINIHHLQQLLKVDVDFLSNKWLFKYLTVLLDKRVIAMLKTQSAQYLMQPVSININAETLLSEQFTEFDASLHPAQKVGIVFEVPVLDVFADMTAFAIARDTAQKRGYRVCVDGLTTQSFLHLNRESIKADLIKLQWPADQPSELDRPENQTLKFAIQACGVGRVILCRCDSKAALEYGQALGLSLFQGRHLDGMLNPLSKVSN